MQTIWARCISARRGIEFQGDPFQAPQTIINDCSWGFHTMVEVVEHRNRLQEVHEVVEARYWLHAPRISGVEEEWKERAGGEWWGTTSPGFRGCPVDPTYRKWNGSSFWYFYQMCHPGEYLIQTKPMFRCISSCGSLGFRIYFLQNRFFLKNWEINLEYVGI